MNVDVVLVDVDNSNEDDVDERRSTREGATYLTSSVNNACRLLAVNFCAKDSLLYVQLRRMT